MSDHNLKEIYKNWREKYTFLKNKPGGSDRLQFTLREDSKGQLYIVVSFYKSSRNFRGLYDQEEVFINLALSDDLDHIVEDLVFTSAGGDIHLLPYNIKSKVGKGLMISTVDDWLNSLKSVYGSSPKQARRDRFVASEFKYAENLYPFSVGDYVKVYRSGFIARVVSDLNENGRYTVMYRSTNPNLKQPKRVVTYRQDLKPDQMTKVKVLGEGMIDDVTDALGPHFVAILDDGSTLNGFSKERMAEYLKLIKSKGLKLAGTVSSYFKYAAEEDEGLGELGEDEDLLAADEEEASVQDEELTPDELFVEIKNDFINGDFETMVANIESLGGLNKLLADTSKLKSLTPKDVTNIARIYSKMQGV